MPGAGIVDHRTGDRWPVVQNGGCKMPRLEVEPEISSVFVGGMPLALLSKRGTNPPCPGTKNPGLIWIKKSKALVISRVVPRKKAQKRKNRGNGKGSITPMGHAFLVAQVNPFLPVCDGLKIPDAAMYPSVALKGRASYSMSTDATYVTGQVRWFTPMPFCGRYAPASITAGGAVTWAAGTTTAIGNYTQIAADYGQCRIVAGGLRITTDTSITSAAGHIYVAHIPIDLSLDTVGYSFLPTTVAASVNQTCIEKYSITELATKPLVVPFKRLDHGFGRYRDITNNVIAAGVENMNGWAGILVWGAGWPATQTLEIEYLTHLECLPITTGVAVPSLAPAAPYDPRAMQTAANATSTLPVAHIETAQEEMDSMPWVERVLAAAAYGAQLAGRTASVYNAARRVIGSTRTPATSYARLMYQVD